VIGVPTTGAQTRALTPGAAFRTLLAFELRWHARDFFAWLALLVFLLLTFGYASTGVVMLVSDLGSAPRNAPLAIAQAMAGVTAFGQVITAITAATTVLRDVGTRTQDLLLTTRLGWTSYLTGRFAGTLLVLAVIYLAIPAGLAAGDAFAGWRGDPAHQAQDAAVFLRPLLWIVVPNVLVVAVAFFAVGAVWGGFAPILFVGLAFVGLWQLGLALAAAGVPAGALVDPFGTAAMLVATADWSTSQRTRELMPVSDLFVANRAAWLVLASLLFGGMLRIWHPRLADARSLPRAVRPDHPGASAATPGTDHRRRGVADQRVRLAVAPRRATSRSAFAAEVRFGWRWVTRERGFSTLVGLALLNAVAHGWPVAGDPTALVRALEFHARLFGILLATIYAGELIWRDRDVRADAMLSALPTPAALRLVARTAGVLAALQALPLALWVAALALPVLHGYAPAAGCAARWLLGVTAPAFALLLLLSVLVHRVVQHKTVAHLLLIAAWVAAVALGGATLAGPWQAWGACG
jgi:hypothetical protein